MERASVNYGADLIDELIQADIKKRLKYEGEVEIVYTHKRAIKKTEAIVYIGTCEDGETVTSNEKATHELVPKAGVETRKPDPVEVPAEEQHVLPLSDAACDPIEEVEQAEVTEDSPETVDSMFADEPDLTEPEASVDDGGIFETAEDIPAATEANTTSEPDVDDSDSLFA